MSSSNTATVYNTASLSQNISLIYMSSKCWVILNKSLLSSLCNINKIFLSTMDKTFFALLPELLILSKGRNSNLKCSCYLYSVICQLYLNKSGKNMLNVFTIYEIVIIIYNYFHLNLSYTLPKYFLCEINQERSRKDCD